MCDSLLSRRQLFAAGAASACLGVVGRGLRAEETSASPEAYPAGAEAALARLMDGNQRFVTGAARHPHAEKTWLRGLEETQRPFATILSCSDSRVPPELLFDQGFGDLFVIRVAGQVIDPATVGSLEYAVLHLKTPLVLVLGHEKCGAVTAAVQALTGEHKEPEKIQALVDLIEPGLQGLDLGGDRDQVIREAVAANVRWTIEQVDKLQTSDEPSIRAVGAVYELDRGEVRLLS
jgi:carbonic anhydrase